MNKDTTELFYFIDEFCNYIEKALKERTIAHRKKATRLPGLTHAEIITIILLFQRSPYKNFKYFYKAYQVLYPREFPRMPSYERFVILQQRVLPLLAVLLDCLFVRDDNVGFIDSTPLTVCHNKRISRHKVCKGFAEIGRSTKGWFYGIKLHIIIDRKGNLMNIMFTKGNVHDVSVVEKLSSFFRGLIIGDRGYISDNLFKRLHKKGITLVTGIKRNMKNVLIGTYEKMLLKKRSIIETVFGNLKEIFMIEHHRHRSCINMFIHIISTLISYQLKPSKPSLSLPLPLLP